MGKGYRALYGDFPAVVDCADLSWSKGVVAGMYALLLVPSRFLAAPARTSPPLLLVDLRRQVDSLDCKTSTLVLKLFHSLPL
jgi:hypothetical protein